MAFDIRTRVAFKPPKANLLALCFALAHSFARVSNLDFHKTIDITVWNLSFVLETVIKFVRCFEQQSSSVGSDTPRRSLRTVNSPQIGSTPERLRHWSV
jgi:hypothetical protein